MDEIILVYVTASSKDEAAHIANKVIKERLCACVNIIPEVRSIYMWEGKMRNGSEAAMIIKTRKSLFEELKEKICILHSYDTPCVLSIPVSDSSKPFADWILDETR